MKGICVSDRIFWETDMVSRFPRLPRQPLRDFPTYTIPEAATYLAMPIDTLRYWVSDEPVWPVAGGQLSIPLLSFRDLAQAYYVETVRKHFGLSLQKTRRVLQAAKMESKAEYPLLKKNILVFFKHIVMDKPARGRQPRRLIDLSQPRQLAIGEVVDRFATRIRWDSRHEPMQLFPWRYWQPGKDESRPVSLDPNVMSGKLVITGTRIPVQLVRQREYAGESIPELARDYGLSQEIIRQALRHFVSQKVA